MKDIFVIDGVREKKCTGCGACKNSCPMDAIRMIENVDGFLVPEIDKNKCVDCKKCRYSCPILNKQNNLNNINPDTYAVRGSDNIRKKSSSGGVFSVLANYVLKKNGYVAGAVFDQGLQVKHKLIHFQAELVNMQGSKYIQSNTEFIYREVEEVLKQENYVLFSGCPCQVAGLKQYLKKDYSKLLLVDIICHGVPSQYIFNKYLNEIAKGRTVKQVKFRDKRLGWKSTTLYVEYENGETYEGDWKFDVYEIGFQKNIFLRESCEECEFCTFPRQGDITIGDFWQVEKIDASQNDGKGTSLVFFNNDKGKMFFRNARTLSTRIKRLDVSKDIIPNRLYSKLQSHEGRNRFFKLVSNRTVHKAINMVEKRKYDIGLVGIHTVGNFGGALTYYALYKELNRMGYSVLMIERPLDAKDKPDYLGPYLINPYEKYDVAPFFNNKYEMRKLNNQCDIFLIGSDQLFNDVLYHNFGKWCTLDWVNDNKKKIAYAASFGHDYIWSDEETRAEMSFFMKKFDAFSVRENSGVKIAKDEFGVEATWVLDPVFLCEVDIYDELIGCVKKDHIHDYLGAYILDPTYEKQQILEKIADKLNLKIEVYSEMIYENPNNGWKLEVSAGKIEERLFSIKNSSFFVADSFHGICFSIIFNKQFIAINNKRRGKSRLESILELLGLSDRLVETVEDLDRALNHPIDYKKVNKALDVEKKRCSQWLQTALSDNKKKPYSDYDIYCHQMHELWKKVNVLQKNNRELSEQLKILKNGFREEFSCIRDINQYFEKISYEIDNLIVLLAVRDTPGHFFNGVTYELMKKIGLQSNLVNKHWYAYIGIVNGRNNVDEILSKVGSAEISKSIETLNISIVSKAYNNGDDAQILINNKNWSVNRRGLNIVLISKETLLPIDAVCFDTHSPNNIYYR